MHFFSLANYPRLLSSRHGQIIQITACLVTLEERFLSWHKQRLKIAKLHERIANQRKEFLHKKSHQLANHYDCVVIEQVLNIQGASYAYGSRNRLTQVTAEKEKAVSNRYNGDNLMVERSTGGVTTRYYDDDRANRSGRKGRSR
ncbi:transposase [Paenibacillus thiaminolyticus]